MTQPTPKREVTISERGEHVYFYLNSDTAPSWFGAARGDNVQVLMAEAVLFTAAPELLKACQAVMRMIESHQIYDKDARGVLQAAIDAATNAPVREDKQEDGNCE